MATKKSNAVSKKVTEKAEAMSKAIVSSIVANDNIKAAVRITKIPKTPYASAVCNLTMLRQSMSHDVTDNEYGYVLVGDDMVSFELIQRVADNVRFNPLMYGSTISADEMVHAEFWDGLDEYERPLVGPCLLILIGNGTIEIREQSIDLR